MQRGVLFELESVQPSAGGCLSPLSEFPEAEVLLLPGVVFQVGLLGLVVVAMPPPAW